MKLVLISLLSFIMTSCIDQSDPMKDIPMPGNKKVSVCSCKADLNRIGQDESLSQAEKVRRIQQVMGPCEKLYDELGEEEFVRQEEACE